MKYQMQNEILSADTVVHTIGEAIPDGAIMKPLVPANASAAAAATSSAAELRSITDGVQL
jgi:N-methylhydantoinase B/oxoprolinase/acetone carboxylase alpha subunit